MFKRMHQAVSLALALGLGQLGLNAHVCEGWSASKVRQHRPSAPPDSPQTLHPSNTWPWQSQKYRRQLPAHLFPLLSPSVPWSELIRHRFSPPYHLKISKSEGQMFWLRFSFPARARLLPLLRSEVSWRQEFKVLGGRLEAGKILCYIREGWMYWYDRASVCIILIYPPKGPMYNGVGWKPETKRYCLNLRPWHQCHSHYLSLPCCENVTGKLPDTRSRMDKWSGEVSSDNQQHTKGKI